MTAQPWIAGAIVAAAATLMIFRSLRGGNPVDFSFILVAGRMWAAGLDPYGPGFASAGAGIFPPDGVSFAYPPNWWLIAAGLGALESASRRGC